MSDEDADWRARLDAAARVRVRTGQDPRWKKLGNASEMGVLSGIGWANLITEQGVVPKPVPGEYWQLDAIDGEPVAIVACPCGHQPTVRALAAPAPCEHDECECERFFFFDGSDVWAFNSPSERVVALQQD